MRGRRIVIVRHGERVDFTFNDDWIKTCFSDDNIYIKHNLNMPDKVPKRSSPQSFLRDCPLTQIGDFQAILTGKGVMEEKLLQDGFEVFVSPALRCVQTAEALGRGMKTDSALKIEHGLFEWGGWFRDFMPTWMTLEELKDNGFNVDDSYVTCSTINPEEELEEFYERSHKIIQEIISSTDASKDILIVTHGVLLETLTRQLTGGSPRNLSELMSLLRCIPYCAVAVIEQNANSKEWSIISVPRVTMTHSGVHNFDAVKTLKNGR